LQFEFTTVGGGVALVVVVVVDVVGVLVLLVVVVEDVVALLEDVLALLEDVEVVPGGAGVVLLDEPPQPAMMPAVITAKLQNMAARAIGEGRRWRGAGGGKTGTRPSVPSERPAVIGLSVRFAPRPPA
jgi:hypothetical protein